MQTKANKNLKMRLRQGSFLRYKKMQNSIGERLREEERTAAELVGTVSVQN